ncbi:MAG: glucosaminidase domain-containing protein [Bacteroidales bacterium]|jgi:LysM repeat protein
MNINDKMIAPDFTRMARKTSLFISSLIIFCSGIIFILPLNAQNSGYDEAAKTYIQAYKDLAIREMLQYRIPASIILAQGLYESNAGRSLLSKEANNHFGIKCHKEWTGLTFRQDDETKNECFRKYDSPEESFRDHSVYLSTQDRYKPLFRLDITDYKGWAKGLKSCGYATNPQYSEHLIKSIEDYNLNRFDVADLSFVNDSMQPAKDSFKTISQNNKYEYFAEGPGQRSVYLNNGLQFTIVRKNDNIKNVAKAFHVSEKKIRKFNDMKNDTPLVTGQMVYLEPKKRNGAVPSHYAKRGESLYTISQLYGIELSRLYKINKYKQGHQIKAGQKILLR